MDTVTIKTQAIQADALSDEELITLFLEDCKLQMLSPETIRSHKSNLKTVARFLEHHGTSIRDVNKHVLRMLLYYLSKERRVSTKTLGSYFSALSSFFQYLNYEELHDGNPVPPFRKRYLRMYKHSKNNPGFERKLITVEEMAMLINSVLDPRDKAIITVLAKTGVRRGELIDMDIEDIDWKKQKIRLKPKAKRSNRTVFFDDETALILRRWLRARENYNVKPGCRALFVGEHGERLKRHGIYHAVTKNAARLGLHNPNSDMVADHFTPHCCRHWFTTWLRRNGMSREFLKELRGDSRREAVDIYDHIDPKELRRAYLAAIPRLGIV